MAISASDVKKLREMTGAGMMDSKKALEATKGCTLTHSIGKNKQNETVLTTSEFCGRLTYLRDKGPLPVKNEYIVVQQTLF